MPGIRARVFDLVFSFEKFPETFFQWARLLALILTLIPIHQVNPNRPPFTKCDLSEIKKNTRSNAVSNTFSLWHPLPDSQSFTLERQQRLCPSRLQILSNLYQSSTSTTTYTSLQITSLITSSYRPYGSTIGRGYLT
jgi:hypothetical protein